MGKQFIEFDPTSEVDLAEATAELKKEGFEISNGAPGATRIANGVAATLKYKAVVTMRIEWEERTEEELKAMQTELN